jgi:hypothetical protein
MRIPLRKIYRAFPELDRFDDAQCQRFVRQAERLVLSRRVERHVLEIAAGSLAFVVVLLLGEVWRRLAGGPGSMRLLVLVPMLAAAPIIAGLIARDLLLRSAIRARLRSARCPRCEYSLLGLPVEDGAARCPECGESIPLEHYGLSEEDLLGEKACREPVTSA